MIIVNKTETLICIFMKISYSFMIAKIKSKSPGEKHGFGPRKNESWDKNEFSRRVAWYVQIEEEI